MGKGGRSLSSERSSFPQFLLLFTHAFPRPRETAQLGPEGIDTAHVLGGNGKGHDAVEQTAPLLLALAAFDLRALVGLGQDGQKRDAVPRAKSARSRSNACGGIRQSSSRAKALSVGVFVR